MRITRQELIHPVHTPGVDNTDLINYVETILASSGFVMGKYSVYDWQFVSEKIRTLCNWNGGDEDWIVIVSDELSYIPNWMEAMGDLDIYLLRNCVIYVGSHA